MEFSAKYSPVAFQQRFYLQSQIKNFNLIKCVNITDLYKKVLHNVNRQDCCRQCVFLYPIIMVFRHLFNQSVSQNWKKRLGSVLRLSDNALSGHLTVNDLPKLEPDIRQSPFRQIRSQNDSINFNLTRHKPEIIYVELK